MSIRSGPRAAARLARWVVATQGARRDGVLMARTVRHAVITGASSGLGMALAIQLAGRGARLTLIARDESRLGTCAQQCRLGGARLVQQLVADVTDPDLMRARLREVDASEPIDIVIANAGLGGSAVLAPSTAESPDLARAIFDVNVLGIVNTVTPLIERMVARKSGHLVLISSMAAYQGLADSPAYSASKAAVRIYGEGIGRLLGPHGIRVTVACPGFIDTPMSRSLPFAQPFLCSADAAAQSIIRAVDRNRREVAFPWQYLWLARLADILPRSLTDLILAAGRSRL